MANLRELMLRLRPAGAPGPASMAGVPSDRRTRVEQELEPVFAALADAVDHGRELRQNAAVEATQRIDEAAQRARTQLAQASMQATALRAELAARLRAQAQDDAATLVREAEAAAARVRERAQRELPQQVGKVTARVRAELTALAESAKEAGSEGP